jgi:protein-tyrosine phosphatase
VTDDRTAARSGRVDFHNHTIPGVDDGAQDRAECAGALSSFAAQGVTAIVATPHVDLSAVRGGGLGLRLAEIDRGWSELEAVAEGCGIAVHRGAELRLGAADPDLSDLRLRLAGTRFVLVEFPYFTVPLRSARTLALIVQRGWLPIIAHPERYDGLDPDLEVVHDWRQAGAYVQVNGPAILGRYGQAARYHALGMLERGWVDFLCSDYHARGRLRLEEYWDAIVAMNGSDQAELLMVTNPARVLRDERPTPVAPLPGAAAERGRTHESEGGMRSRPARSGGEGA